jgi:hypothetical protein
MAQKVLISMVDDIDGGEAHGTVTFGLDGIAYEIDLSDDHAATLRDELAPYIGHARRTGGRKARGTTQAPATVPNRERTQAIRAWAIDNGYEMSARGRISTTIVEAYDTAQAQPEPEAKPARKRRAAKKPTS